MKTIVKRMGIAPKRSEMNTVVFDPVIGREYEENGGRILGRRILVVGASHYCEHYNSKTGCGENCVCYGNYRMTIGGRELYCGRSCERFTAMVYERYRNRLGMRNERRWMRTLSRFYNSFFEGGNPTDEERNSLLDHLVCTEYVQGAEAKVGEQNNPLLMEAVRNFDELVRCVERVKPEVVVFWGSRVWREVCRHLRISETYAVKLEIELGGNQVTLIRVSHPSSRGRNGFNRTEFAQLLKSSGVRLLRAGRNDFAAYS